MVATASGKRAAAMIGEAIRSVGFHGKNINLSHDLSILPVELDADSTLPPDPPFRRYGSFRHSFLPTIGKLGVRKDLLRTLEALAA